MHDSFSGALAEGSVEVIAIVKGQVVSRKWLAAVLVYPLENLSFRLAWVFDTIRIYSGHGPCNQQRSLDPEREK